MGWDRPYQEQFAAFSAAYGQWLQQQRAPQMEELATVPLPTQESAPAPVDTAPVPQIPPSTSGENNSSWMWGKGALDSPRQTGVDRAGVHTSEPMLQNNSR
ncbi:MAG TPA: hypothetical protein VGM54_18460 [Chthoniobacter sp.]